jgi:flagellin-like protein
MKMWANTERSFRMRRKRAVSPIIATILLVAITVVLAAVLYILISNLTKGPGNTPLGSAFAFGSPTQQSVAHGGTASSGCAVPTAGTDYCELINIGEASSGLATNSIGFQLQSPTGTITSFTSVVLLDQVGAGIAIYSGATFTWSLCTIATCNVAAVSTITTALPATLATTQEMVIQVSPAGGGTSPTGDILVALGTGSFSGQVSQTLA